MEAGGVERIDHLHLLALAHLWRALLALGQPDAVHAELRAVHKLFLESRVVAVRTRAGDPGNLDSLLDRDLSPYTLLLFNEHLAPAQRSAALDRALALGRAWGEVAPLEMQGLAPEGAEGSATGDLFRDPERLALLKAIREARKGELLRQQDELTLKRSHGDLLEIEADEEWNVILSQFYPIKEAEKNERDLLGEKPATPPRKVYLQLLDYLTPSMHAYTLAGELRSDGRSAEARELCEHALAVLRTAPLGSSIWSELSSARFENLRGSALMDESRPREAEQAYLESEKRLAAIEVKVNEWIASSKDPEPARAYLTQIQNLRGDALLSLAVNANVRFGDPAKALEYFERAYALNQSPFMRVLRACYRARSGKKDEARTVLASVVPVPSLYYNIACTHALLGEKEVALDYLERDARENCPSPGSLAQKRAWAAKDPDIASLREEPRFQRLLGGP
jgi:tetratricopeptide (TPR) repeat protein